MKNIPVTVVIPTRNEEANIELCLRSAARAQYVLVVDSHSSDSTRAICREFGAEVTPFEYRGGYPKKRQWALDTWPFKTEWILLLDADERVGPELWDEIDKVILSDPAAAAYLIRKQFCFLGKRFRFGGFSHRAVALFRRGNVRFEDLSSVDCGVDMEVHERLVVNGIAAHLHSSLEHWDERGLHHYIKKHNEYSTWEASARQNLRRFGILSVGLNLTGLQRLRRVLKRIAISTPFEPLAWFLFHYFICLGVLEGRRGFVASRIRATYIADVRDKLWALDRVK